MNFSAVVAELGLGRGKLDDEKGSCQRVREDRRRAGLMRSCSSSAEGSAAMVEDELLVSLSLEPIRGVCYGGD